MKQIEELQQEIKEFCDERDWEQFHNAKDLAIGISTEAGELLDLFRFKDSEEAFLNHRADIEEESADVFFFLLRFAQMNAIDLEEVLKRKLEKNAEKYPIDKAKGSNKKYNEF